MKKRFCLFALALALSLLALNRVMLREDSERNTARFTTKSSPSMSSFWGRATSWTRCIPPSCTTGRG